MRQSTLKFVSVGLLFGVIVGCGKESGTGSGVAGLCSKVSECANVEEDPQCASSLSMCQNADAKADDCLAMGGCDEIFACYALFGLDCAGPTTGTSGDSAGTEGNTSSPTEASAGTTDGPTTTNPGTSMTTDVNPETTNVPGTDTTDPTVDPDTTAAPDTTDTPETTTMGGSDIYGPCPAMGMCPDGGDCLMVQDVDGSFCSPKCDDMTPCPASGVNAEAMCLLSMMGMDPTNCILLCAADGDCPAGMTCKMVPMNTAKICSAP